MTEEFTISTNLSSDEIKERIQKLLKKKWGIPFLFRKVIYKGEIKKDNFIINSQFDDPPIVLKGEISENIIAVKVSWDSMKKAYSGLIWGLGFPAVFMVMFFIIYDNPKSVLSYIFCSILFLAFYIFQKIFVFLQYQEPNPKGIIKDVKKALR